MWINFSTWPIFSTGTTCGTRDKSEVWVSDDDDACMTFNEVGRCVARKFWSELLLAADSPSPILMLIPKPFPDAILNFEISKKLIVSF